MVNRHLSEYACVIEDPAAGARAADLLVRANRTRLAILHGSPLTQATRARVDSFVSATARQLGTPAQEIVAATLTEAASFQAVAQFLSAGGRADGLYAVSDSMALGAYHAIKRHGLSIPGDIAIVGVGDSEIGPYLDPPLSHVGVSRDQIGKIASRLLLQQIDQRAKPAEKIIIPVRTVQRESLGKRRQARRAASAESGQ